MSDLKNVRLLKMKVGGDDNSLMDALEMIISSWLDDACGLYTTNINLLEVKNYEDLDPEMKLKDPFICLCPKRQDAWGPGAGFEKPVKLFGQKGYRALRLGYKKAIVLQKIGDLIRNQNFINKHMIEYKKRNPTSQFEQGGAYWEAFTIEYDADWYEAYLCISFSGYATYA